MREEEAIRGFEKDDVTASQRASGRPGGPAREQSAVRGSELGGAANDNPLLRASGLLLLLLGRLRAGLLRARAEQLAPQIAAAINTCEGDMIGAGIPPVEASRAKSILCATADEVLASLPEADRARTGEPVLLTSLFFGASDGGQRFFDALKRVKADPKTHHRLLELLHACLALGFDGPHQTMPGGAALLQDVRHDLYVLLEKAGPASPDDLSPRWQGQRLAAGRASAPFWTVAALIGLLLFGVFTGLRLSLARRAEAASDALISLNPQTPASISRKAAVAPPTLDVTPTAQLEHIRAALAPDIEAGTLSVASTADQIVIRIADRALFRPGEAAILDGARSLVTYIALALDADDGGVKVVGRSDDRRISNLRFASNFELSLERANVVAALLAQSLSHPERVRAEAKGSNRPIVSKDSAAGSDANRSIEIIIPRSV